MIGAIIWNLITWYFGLPTSSSHALFGGYGGAAIAKAGFSAIIVAGWTKTIIFIVLAPLIGLTVGLIVMTSIFWMFRRFDAVARRSLVPPHAARVRLGLQPDARRQRRAEDDGHHHGRAPDRRVPREVRGAAWVEVMSYTAIGLGTLSGGWRIIKTMGTKITKLQPAGGFAAETGAAVAIFIATHLGVGISTTHTITGAIVGVGATRRLSAVRWGIAGQIVWAWILTIPASATIGALMLSRRAVLRALRADL